MMSAKYGELLSHEQQQDIEIKALGKRIVQIEQAKANHKLQKLKNDVV